MKLAFVQGPGPPALCDRRMRGKLGKQAMTGRPSLMICLIQFPLGQCLPFKSPHNTPKCLFPGSGSVPASIPRISRYTLTLGCLHRSRSERPACLFLQAPVGLSELSACTGRAVRGWNSGRKRAKPQCRPLGFCGFQPKPRCYFSTTSVFNLRMCVDQKEGPKHYFFFPPSAK